MKQSSTTVVIPAFRSAGTLRKAVVSCLADGLDREVIVVFDGPDPAAERTLEGLRGVRIVVQAEGRGAPTCRNIGWKLASTDYVIFLDADDYVENGFLTAAEARAEADQADVVFGRFAFEYRDGSRRYVDPKRIYEDFEPATIMKQWLVGHYIPPCAVLWRRSFVASLGGWDEALAKNQDGDLMYRALFQRPRITSISDGHGVYVQDDDPKRITKRHDRRMLASQIAVLDKIRARMEALGVDLHAELGFTYYNLARLAFTHRVDEIGERAERAARDLGVHGQPGEFLHSVVATVFGLRGKQRLAQFMREAPAKPKRLFELSPARR